MCFSASTSTIAWREPSATLPALRGEQALQRAILIVEGCPHPLKTARVRVEVPAGGNVQELLLRACAGADLNPRFLSQAHVWLGDVYLPRPTWDRVRPKAGSHLTFRTVPQGNMFRTILMLAVVIGAAIFAPILAGPLYMGLTPILGTALGTAVVGGVLTVAGMLLINALIPLKPPSLPSANGLAAGGSGGNTRATSPTYALQAPRNTARPWDPIPAVLGYHRQTPPLGALPYTELVGDDQYVRLLLVWGYGPLQVTDLRLGETPLTSYADVEVEHRAGYADDAPLRLFPGQVFEEALSIALTQVAGWQTRTTSADVDELAIDLTFPNGLGQINPGSGDLLTASVNVEAEYRQDQGGGAFGDWVPFLRAGTPDAAIASATFWLNSAHEQGASGDPGSIGSRVWLTASGRLELREGPLKPVNQAEFPAIPAGVYSIARVTVTADNITAVVMELHEDLTGFTTTAGTGLRELNVAGGTFASGEASFEAAQAEVLRRTITRQLGLRGTWEVRVRRLTPDSDNAYVRDQLQWTALRAFRHDPPVSFPQPLAMTAIRMRASEQLNGLPDEINGLCFSIAPMWNGTTWATTATWDPASLFRHVLQGPANAQPLTDDELDLASLQAWSGYCQGNGYTYNAVHDFRASVWETLLDIAAAGRGIIVHRDGQWGVVIEEQAATQPPTQHFSPRNSWGFAAERVYREVPHAWRCRFINAAEGWQPDERFIYDDGYDVTTATRIEQIELPGVTDAELAWRHGRYRLAELTLRPETYQFSADVEHLLCRVGDRIRVAHDVTLWGIAQGRVTVVDVALSRISLDEPVPMETGQSYQVRFRLQDGSSLVRGVTTVAGEQEELTLTSGSGFPAVGDLALFGLVNLESVDLLVSRIEPAEDLSARLTCVDLAPAIYQADEGDIPDWDPQITRPVDWRTLPPQAPVILGIASDESAVVPSEGRRVQRYMIVHLSREPGDQIPCKFYETWYKRHAEQSAWTQVNVPVGQPYLYVPNVRLGQTYDVQARLWSLWDVPSPWDTATHTIGTLAWTPDNPVNLTLQPKWRSFVARWDAVTNATRYELGASLTADLDEGSSVYVGEATGATVMAVAPGTTAWFWVRAFFDDGSVSPWYPDAAGPGVAGTTLELTVADLPPLDLSRWAYNPSFEEGDTGWQRLGRWAIVQDSLSARSGAWAGQHGPGATETEYLVNLHWFAVDAGDFYWLRGYVRSTGDANGTCGAVIAWYDDEHTFVTATAVNALSATTSWAVSTGLVQAPAGAVYGLVAFLVAGHSTGTWDVDDIDIDRGVIATRITGGSILDEHIGSGRSLLADTAVDGSKRPIVDFALSHVGKILDNIGDGSTYGRTLLTALTSGQVDLSNAGVIGLLSGAKIAAKAISSGHLGVAVTRDNLVLNPSAEDALNGWTRVDGSGAVDVSSATKTDGAYSFAIPAMTALGCRAFPITPGETYRVRGMIRGSTATGSGIYVRMFETAAYPSGDYILSGAQDSYTDLAANAAVPSSFAEFVFAYQAPAGSYWCTFSVYNWTGGPTTVSLDEIDIRPKFSRTHLRDAIIDDSAVAGGRSLLSSSYVGASKEPQVLDAAQMAAGIINDGHLNAANESYPRRYYVERAVPTTGGQSIRIGNFQVVAGAFSLDISIVVSDTSFSVAKDYSLRARYGLAAVWNVVRPSTDTGAYSGNDFELDASVGNGIMYLRVRRSSGSTVGTAKISMVMQGDPSTTFTAETGIENDAPVGYYPVRPLVDFAADHFNKHLDNISDGSTYQRTTANEKTGAGRAFTGLDSAGLLTTGVAGGPSVSDIINAVATNGTAQNLNLGSIAAGSLDNIPDGATYQRVLGVASGLVTVASLAAGIARRLNTSHDNLVVNGSGYDGTSGWTYSSGAALQADDDANGHGGRSLLINHSTTAQDSYSYQDVTLVSGTLYELSAWIWLQNAIAGTGTPFGAVLNLDPISGISGWTIVQKAGDDPSSTSPDVGLNRTRAPGSGNSSGWVFVRSRVIPVGSGTARLFLQLGYGGTVEGAAWFEGVTLKPLLSAKTEEVASGAVTDDYGAAGTTGTYGAETVVATVSIGGTYQTGSCKVYGRANFSTILNGDIGVLRVRRTGVSGVIVAMQAFPNWSGGSLSIELFAVGKDTSPPWSGQYVLTVEGVGGNVTISTTLRLDVEHTKV